MNTLKIAKEFPVYGIYTKDRVNAQSNGGIIHVNKEWIGKKVVIIVGIHSEEEINSKIFSTYIEKVVLPNNQKVKGQYKLYNGRVWLHHSWVNKPVTVILVEPLQLDQ